MDRRRSESGQATLERVAALALAGLLVVATLVAFQQAGAGQALATKVCRVVAALPGGPGEGCGLVRGDSADPDLSGTPDDDLYRESWSCRVFGAGCYVPSTEGGDPRPEDAPQPWYCRVFGTGCHATADVSQVRIPNGMDPGSGLVKTLLATARGRSTLNWLSSNGVPVVVSPNATGACWTGTEIVLGPDYDNAPVLVHEANHAIGTAYGTSGDAQVQDRQGFIITSVNEEVFGTVRQIQAAKELRAAGYATAEQPMERVFDRAWGNAKASGADDAAAFDAATKDVSSWYFDGRVRTSTTDEPYTEFYGRYWDLVNP